jgi:hypothetical protein
MMRTALNLFRGAKQQLLVAAVIGLGALTSHGATVAHWNFEDGTAGVPFTPTGQPDGSGGTHDTANNILMRGWNDFYGPGFSNFVTTNGGKLSMQNADNHQDGYVLEGALHNWSPTAWTVEATIYLESLGGWNSLIGRDGSTVSSPEGDFYLQNNGIDDKFRINFVTAGGQRWVMDGDYAPQANKWYGIAVVSDGVMLSMLLDDGTGYQQIGSLDMSTQTVAQNALKSSALNWTFGRGWYNGGFVDHIDGYMDNIRFSDVALSANQLIGIVPEPSSMLLMLASIGLLAGRRGRG